jgi:ABC-type polysaccharide/polyol phosphate export permease
MLRYLRSVWECRYFWLSLVRMDLRARYRGSVIGVGWSLLNPAAMSAILCVVFTRLFHQEVREYGPYLFAGLTFWNYFVGITQAGCDTFFRGESYIRQFPAPMAIYPLRTMLGCAFHYAVALVVVVGLTAALKGGVPLLPLLALPPGMLLLMALGWSGATLIGLANVRFRDTRHMSDIFLQALYFLTPVLYPAKLLEGRPKLGLLLEFNPLVPFLRILRDPVLDGAFPAPGAFASAGLIALTAVAVAAAALRAEERRLIFHL